MPQAGQQQLQMPAPAAARPLQQPQVSLPPQLPQALQQQQHRQLQIPAAAHQQPQQQQQQQQGQGSQSDDDDDDDDDVRGGSSSFAHAPPAEMTRPCKHNDWDDVRTRKGSKILRCRVCQSKWKLPSARVPRCSPFLCGHCDRGDSCDMVHVHKRKSNLVERFERFGDFVLRGVPAETWEKVKTTSAEPEMKPADQAPAPMPAQAVAPHNGESPTAGLKSRTSSASAPSLLSTDAEPSPKGNPRYLGRQPPALTIPANPSANGQSPKSIGASSPPSLLCSPTSTIQTPHRLHPMQQNTSTTAPAPHVPRPARTPFGSKRGFAPPTIDTTASVSETTPATQQQAPAIPDGGAAAPAMQLQPSPQSIALNVSVSDTQSLLPPELLSPGASTIASTRAMPFDNKILSPIPHVQKVDSVWSGAGEQTPAGPPQMIQTGYSPLSAVHSETSQPNTPTPHAIRPVTKGQVVMTHRMRMQQQLQSAVANATADAAAAQPASSPVDGGAAPPPGAKKLRARKENEGVHAMTEAELDAHLENLGLSPGNTPKAAATAAALSRPTLPVAKPPVPSQPQAQAPAAAPQE
ncbi:hypothetical protein DIPPA_29031 [Diplonema papillatum]|nr:hypothetical protein DIPPA_29031 [Diplonema papillatum]